MKVKDEHDVGVIVGRFQVHELHQGHLDLLQTVTKRHAKVLVFLGLSPLRVTKENPLDFESRKQMILDKFPKVTVLYVKDVGDDNVWSKRLDEQITDNITPSQTAVLYGSRDSFITHYHGKFSTQELEQDAYFSGTEVRKTISRSVRSTVDFRAGVIWASASTFPTCYPTVDIAIFSRSGDRILLGRKPNESLYRLIGGFADPGSESYEDDARREVLEEASIEITDPIYVGSQKVDDWRYRSEQDCIKTILFIAFHKSGDPRPDDDIAEVRWFKLEDLKEGLTLHDTVIPSHQHLVERAIYVGLENNPPSLGWEDKKV